MEATFIVRVRYRNPNGEKVVLRIIPKRIEYTSKYWFQPEWVLEALNVDKKNDCILRLEQILEWGVPEESADAAQHQPNP